MQSRGWLVALFVPVGRARIRNKKLGRYDTSIHTHTGTHIGTHIRTYALRDIVMHLLHSSSHARSWPEAKLGIATAEALGTRPIWTGKVRYPSVSMELKHGVHGGNDRN